MLKTLLHPLRLLLILIILGCGTSDESGTIVEEFPVDQSEADYTYLALGDSYTIGESVCSTCRFPIQLEEALATKTEGSIETDIIATTGWRTDDLINAINNENPANTYDLVTLLIGVNNQYQGRSFSQYETEFPQLLMTAINLAQGNKDRVLVVSIPDYAYTPFGQNSGSAETISEEIDAYNAYARAISEQQGVRFVNITNITRRGIAEPNLVASDGLHPSEDAYAEFVARLLPFAVNILKSEQ